MEGADTFNWTRHQATIAVRFIPLQRKKLGPDIPVQQCCQHLSGALQFLKNVF
jgi:hypothetical protein